MKHRRIAPSLANAATLALVAIAISACASSNVPIRSYPEKAEQMKVQGLAIMGCTVSVEGRLRDCTINYEDPKGWDFGEAALRRAPQFRIVKPASTPVREGHIVIPLVFTLPTTRRDDAILAAWNTAILQAFIQNHQCEDAKKLALKSLGTDERRLASECADPSPWHTDGATF